MSSLGLLGQKWREGRFHEESWRVSPGGPDGGCKSAQGRWYPVQCRAERAQDGWPCLLGLRNLSECDAA